MVSVPQHKPKTSWMRFLFVGGACITTSITFLWIINANLMLVEYAAKQTFSIEQEPIEKVDKSDNNGNISGNASSVIDSNTFTIDNTYIDAFPNQTILQDPNVTYEDIAALINLNITVPRNLNLLMAGDSLTRYQYLDLAYFLRHGSWVQPDDHPSMVIHTDVKGWYAFFNFTNEKLKPYEQCDAYREKGIAANNLRNLENRYYYDDRYNNRLTYLMKNGNFPFKTSWNTSDVYNDHEIVKNVTDLNIIYRAGWLPFLDNFICKLDPKPTAFVFNEGIWPRIELMDEAKQEAIVQKIRECGIISIYKTTTSREVAEYEQKLCNLTDLCMDISWTKKVPREYYFDSHHFVSPIYSMLNVQLMSTLLNKLDKKETD